MISFNKALEAEALQAFLQVQFPGQEIYLCYQTEIDWERVQQEMLVFAYKRQEGLDAGFCFNLNPVLFISSEAHFCASLEKLTYELAQHFECAAFCEASRVQLIKGDPYYSLLFEAGRVYLASDMDWDKTGQVTKIAELSYDWPNYPQHYQIHRKTQ